MLRLPNELLLTVLQMVKQENHLDLSSVASTCHHLQMLVADGSLWTNTIMVDDTDHHDSSYHAIQNSLRNSGPLFTHQLAMVLSNPLSAELVATVLYKQAKETPLQSVHLYAPAERHLSLLKALESGSVQWKDYEIRDPVDPFGILDQSQRFDMLRGSSHLHSLDLPSCPVHWLLSSSFPNVSTLTTALTPWEGSLEEDSVQQQHMFWENVKTAFPHLRDLTLSISDPKAFSLFLSLLSFSECFPWLESVTVVSPVDPRQYIEHETLVDSLMRLEGLARINAGWDLVALHK
ncbi:hypothetical protein BDF14DRAFT_1769084 [Spinellus fusiger]|nr:hypothetical protein BDF14DRAFT_1769084 [Spinellus fusiger]